MNPPHSVDHAEPPAGEDGKSLPIDTASSTVDANAPTQASRPSATEPALAPDLTIDPIEGTGAGPTDDPPTRIGADSDPLILAKTDSFSEAGADAEAEALRIEAQVIDATDLTGAAYPANEAAALAAMVSAAEAAVGSAGKAASSANADGVHRTASDSSTSSPDVGTFSTTSAAAGISSSASTSFAGTSSTAPAGEASNAAPRPSRFRSRALEPLSIPVFRMLWTTWLIANICMWMNDVAAAWKMTTLTSSPIWVALVQSASTLPVFLLGLPSGALADILDRRRWLMATQFWLAATAVVLCVAVALDLITAPLLLALTFANGIGLAMRWPVFSAIVPELVPRSQLPAALGLNGISMNASRIIGPLVAGSIIASAGSVWVFGLNAVLCVASGFVVMRWQREPTHNPLGRERLAGAMRVGVQFVRQSPRMRAVLARIFLFFLHSTALLALLPLLARGMHGGDAGTFTILLAAMGSGAIVTVLFLPRLRGRFDRDELVIRGTILQSAATAVMAFAPNPWVAVPAMFLAGASWITVANSLAVSAQLALPNWVRARGMSIYQMGIMGGTAIGAAVWGQIATWSTLQLALLISAVSSTVMMWLALRYVVDGATEDNLSPAKPGWSNAPPSDDPAPGEGRVVVTVEYLIDPANAEAFHGVMQLTRRTRLAEGALSWDLLHDINHPERYVEQIVDESWIEYLRRHERATQADLELREGRLAFHIVGRPPVVTRYIVQR